MLNALVLAACNTTRPARPERPHEVAVTCAICSALPRKHHATAGDIRKQGNIEGLWQHCRSLWEPRGCAGATLVTADGAIDTQENPNRQEDLTASLHFAELISALGLLAVGGSVFLKAFTIFEHSTLCMLYICGAYFDRVRGILQVPCTFSRLSPHTCASYQMHL